MTNAILAIDPGKATGFAEIRYRDTSAPFIIAAEIVNWGPLEAFDSITRWARQTMNVKDRVIIYETWVPLATGADPNYSCQLIGAIRVAAHQASIPTVGQSPQFRTAIGTEVLKASPYWVSGSADHHREAIRHALAFLTVTLRHKPTLYALHPRPAS